MDADISPKTPVAIRFGNFVLDGQRGTLQAEGRDVALRPKTFALLSYLASNPGRLMSKAELMSAVWPGVVVTDDSLTQCISELRGALVEPGLVQTVARRGYRFEPPVATASSTSPPLDTGSASAAPTPSRLSRRAVFTAVGAAAVLLPAAGWWWHSRAPRLGLDAAWAARRAVAIRPFVDIGPTPAPGLAESVTEDVSVAVARLPDVVLFAGSSSATIRDAADAARRLGASHVVEGSVERRDGGVIVRARLFQAPLGTLLWNERFEYAADSPWTWQRDVTQRIAQSLDVRLREPTRDARIGRFDPVAATQEGLRLVIHATKRADVVAARALFEQALASDPDSVVALTFWAFTHTQQVMRGWSDDPASQVSAASGAVDRALLLRPDYWPAHFHRSFVLYLQGRIDEAAAECEAVLALWPNEPHALLRLAFYRLQQGRPGEVAAPVALALRLNPLEPTQVGVGHFYLGMALFHQRRDDDAYAEMRQVSIIHPRFPYGAQWMAAIDALHGRDADAKANLQAFEAMLPGQSIAKLKATEPSKNVAYWNEHERFYVGLQRAGLAAVLHES